MKRELIIKSFLIAYYILAVSVLVLSQNSRIQTTKLTFVKGRLKTSETMIYNDLNKEIFEVSIDVESNNIFTGRTIYNTSEYSSTSVNTLNNEFQDSIVKKVFYINQEKFEIKSTYTPTSFNESHLISNSQGRTTKEIYITSFFPFNKVDTTQIEFLYDKTNTLYKKLITSSKEISDERFFYDVKGHLIKIEKYSNDQKTFETRFYYKNDYQIRTVNISMKKTNSINSNEKIQLDSLCQNRIRKQLLFGNIKTILWTDKVNAKEVNIHDKKGRLLKKDIYVNGDLLNSEKYKYLKKGKVQIEKKYSLGKDNNKVFYNYELIQVVKKFQTETP